MDGFLTNAEAAPRLGIRPNSLEKWRCAGRGPAYHARGGTGRVFYSPVDIDEWIAAQRVVPTGER